MWYCCTSFIYICYPCLTLKCKDAIHWNPKDIYRDILSLIKPGEVEKLNLSEPLLTIVNQTYSLREWRKNIQKMVYRRPSDITVPSSPPAPLNPSSIPYLASEPSKSKTCKRCQMYEDDYEHCIRTYFVDEIQDLAELDGVVLTFAPENDRLDPKVRVFNHWQVCISLTLVFKSLLKA